MSACAIVAKIRFGRWRQVHRGVYATFTGRSTGTRSCGRPCSTRPARRAAEPRDRRRNRSPHRSPVAIDPRDHPGQQAHQAAAEGVIIHISSTGARLAIRPRDSAAHVCRGDDHRPGARGDRSQRRYRVCDRRVRARKLTSEGAAAAGGGGARKRLRWRGDLDEIIAAGAGGAHSVIEYRYDQDVEQAHGLPPAAKQVRFTKPDGSRGFRDRYYEEYGLIIELDGKQYHPAERRGRDQDRDNDAAATVGSTLRYGWVDVTSKRCESAAAGARRAYQAAAIPDRSNRCSPTCAVTTAAGPASQCKRPVTSYVSSARRTASVSVRSGSTACAPAAASSPAV